MHISSILFKIINTLRRKIKYKMFIIYILVISVPIFVFGIISYEMTSLRIEDDFIKYKENLNKQVMQNIEENIKNLSRQSMAIFANIDDITYILNRPSSSQDVNSLKTSQRISDFFQSILQGNDNLFGITLIDLAGEIRFCYTRSGANLNLYRVHDERWFKDALLLSGQFLLREPHINEFLQKSNYSDDSVISIARTVMDFDTNKLNGMLLIDQNMDQFSAIFSRLDFQPDEFIAILGKTDSIIYTNIPSKSYNFDNIMPSLASMNSGSVKINIDGEVKLVSLYKSQELGWKVISILPVSQLQIKSSFIKDINISLIIILFVFIFFISIFVSYLITIPLKKLVISFKKLQNGDFTAIVSVKGIDELAEIGATFNNMVVNIKALIQQKYELSILRKQAELESLQSQINPHFLFNTLNSINAVADEGDIAKVGIMVRNLSDTFRYSLNRGRQIVKFSEEFEQLKKYLFIQECRFENKYEVFFDIDNEVLNYDIPRLTLQPIVENAIYHGLERKLGKGELKIAAKAVNDKYYIFISNNGFNIPTDELEKINAQLDSDPEMQPNLNPQKLGIFNVNSRIKFIYGNDYGMKFSSIEGAYTTVKISLPTRRQEF